jgi:hypothetical protein
MAMTKLFAWKRKNKRNYSPSYVASFDPAKEITLASPLAKSNQLLQRYNMLSLPSLWVMALCYLAM